MHLKPKDCAASLKLAVLWMSLLTKQFKTEALFRVRRIILFCTMLAMCWICYYKKCYV